MSAACIFSEFPWKIKIEHVYFSRLDRREKTRTCTGFIFLYKKSEKNISALNMGIEPALHHEMVYAVLSERQMWRQMSDFVKFEVLEN